MWPFKKTYKLHVAFMGEKLEIAAPIRTMAFDRIPCVGERITIQYGGNNDGEGKLVYEITEVDWLCAGDLRGHTPTTPTQPIITATLRSHVVYFRDIPPPKEAHEVQV